MEFRIKVLFTTLIIGFLSLFVRLFFWQVIKGEDLADLARLQYKGGSEITAPRGEILASDGTWLAATKPVWLLFANPKRIETSEIDRVSEKLAEILIEKSADDESVKDYKARLLEETLRIKGLLLKRDLSWVAIKHKVDRDIRNEIEHMNVSGFGFEDAEVREYPEASIAAQLLGFVGKDDNGHDKGYFGLEGYYDLMLSGNSGYLTREADPRGVPILFSGNLSEIPAIKGVDLVTSIDKTVQLTIEQKLHDGIKKYDAQGGSVVVMGPKSGEILGMAAYPSFDPADYRSYNNDLFKNPVISSTYEPGSIMKVVIMAAALDAGLVKPDTKCPICDGPYKVGKYLIRTWNDQYRPNSDMTEVVVESDNVGMSYVGNLLGKDRMHDYLTKFGFGLTTGVDLQGEVAPSLRKKGTWSDVDLATSSFGQGVAVTSMQMINAVSTIANGGVSIKPHVVKKVVSGGWSQDVKPEFGERVISQKAASEISAMMAAAASKGESKWTYLSGYKIAGKTGTAQIPIEGHYDAEQTIVSFIGFAPYDDPKFVMLVTLVKPQSSPWAAETAAPLWYKIAEDIFTYYGIQPEK